MLKFKECGETPVQPSCAEHLSRRNHSFPTFVYDDFTTIRATDGYNLVKVSPPVFLRRGAILYASTKKNCQLAIDTSGLAAYSDFAWANKRLNQTANWRFFVRISTNSTWRSEVYGAGRISPILNASRTLSNQYGSPGLYKISAQLLDTSLEASKIVSIG